MVSEMLKRKKFLDLKTGAVLSSLENLTNEDGEIIGDSLKHFLLINKHIVTAVNEWMLSFPALIELDSLVNWIHPFMVTLSEHIYRVFIQIQLEK